jgi:hypothetical protein
MAAREKSAASVSSHATHGRTNGLVASGGTSRRRGLARELAVVVTVTVAEAACVPFRVTEAGTMEHVAADGAPPQLSDTCWLKLLTGVTLRV